MSRQALLVFGTIAGALALLEYVAAPAMLKFLKAEKEAKAKEESAAK